MPPNLHGDLAGKPIDFVAGYWDIENRTFSTAGPMEKFNALSIDLSSAEGKGNALSTYMLTFSGCTS